MKRYFLYMMASFRVEVKNVLSFRADLFMRWFETLLSIAALIAFWTVLYSSRTEISGISMSEMLVYTIAARVLTILLTTSVEYEISSQIYTGDIALSFSLPINYPFSLFLKAIGQTLSKLIFHVVPYIVAGSLAFIVWNPVRVNLGPLFWISTLAGVVLYFLYEMFFGFLAFWTMEIGGVLALRGVIMQFLSGAFIPLWFFPDILLRISKFLPFQALYHTPLSILIGKLEGAALLEAVGLQCAWILLFLLLCSLVFSRAKRRVIVHGG